jgi:hypothetical protein
VKVEYHKDMEILRKKGSNRNPENKFKNRTESHSSRLEQVKEFQDLETK